MGRNLFSQIWQKEEKQISFPFKLATHSTASNSGKKPTNEISKIEFWNNFPTSMKKEHISSRRSKSQMKFPFLFHSNSHTNSICEKQKSNACFWLFLSVSYCIFFFLLLGYFLLLLAVTILSFRAASSGAYGHVVFDVSETDAILIFFIFLLCQHVKTLWAR